MSEIRYILILFVLTFFIKSTSYAALPHFLKKEDFFDLQVGYRVDFDEEQWEVIKMEGNFKLALVLIRFFDTPKDIAVYYYKTHSKELFQETNGIVAVLTFKKVKTE
jgi:hypothetical protein